MVAAPKPAIKLGRALKSAAKLPARVTSGRGSGRGDALSPVQGEQTLVLLRVQILRCRDLAAKDRGGTSDPFVTVTLMNTKHQTPVSKKNLNPDYVPKDATFDFPIYMSQAERLGALELVVWDKDMLKKDYLGEYSLALNDWFPNQEALEFGDAENKPFTVSLDSTREDTPPEGTLTLKVGFVPPPNVRLFMSFAEILAELKGAAGQRQNVLSAPPTAGIGTIRSAMGGPEFEDDGFSSDEDGEESDADYAGPHPGQEPGAGGRAKPARTLSLGLKQHAQEPLAPQHQPPPGSPNELEIRTPMPTDGFPGPEKTPTALKPPSPGGGRFPKLLKRPTLPAMLSSRSVSSSAQQQHPPNAVAPSPSIGGSSPELSGEQPARRKGKFRRGTRENGYQFNAENDIVGIVMIEILSAKDLPRLRNMTRTGWDMDPFVVVSFGKKVFRTRVIRHSRDPVWNEKLLFHVRRYETKFNVQLTVLDWDKISSNDHVGDALLNVEELSKCVPQKNEQTGLYPPEEEGVGQMKEFSLPLSTAKEMPWESKHNPTITFKAKYQSYDALRQKFWRQYLKQYDSDESGQISRLELTSMLDSLGSTLSASTVDSFYTRHNKVPQQDELTIDEAVQCLEQELFRPREEKKRIDADDYHSADTSMSSTPTVASGDALALNLEKMDFSGPPGNIPYGADAGHASVGANDDVLHPNPPPAYATEPMQQPVSDVMNYVGADASSTIIPPSHPGRKVKANRQPSMSGSEAEGDESSGSSNSGSSAQVERVINVKTCPLCHRPRLSSKAEVDIVTHLAICASQDWASVDKIVVGNFVTSSQAQRKWMAKFIGKVSSGSYRLGANSANIIVQNRMTGQLEEEKMQVYVRLGIRLLYKGAKSRMEGTRARNLLKSMSIKQGQKYDSPDSAREILPFIEFHGLKVEEMLEPPESYKTFNEFFYRKLKPNARPVEEPENPYRLVSAADCRMMAFESVTEATKLWIKGREFTVGRLLGDAYKSEAERYTGGALAIFRLAPQDYHRFHSPVDGKIGPMTYIAGEYYTVNPQAVRTALDIYGENARKIVPIDSPQFGRVFAVCVGAMMVGSIVTTVDEGQEVKRGQEFGYFAFGGSTIVLLFEKGVVGWDEDLLINGRASLETLVRVGMGVGRKPNA